MGLEVVATPTIPEVHYNRRRTREVQSQIRDEPSTIAKCEDSHRKDLLGDWPSTYSSESVASSARIRRDL